MAKVVKGDVQAVPGSSLISLLERDISDSAKLRSSIMSFISSSKSELTGPNYDEARSMMERYIPYLMRREAVAKTLIDSIKSGCKSMASYMSPFDVLDEALRAEYEQKLNEAQATLDSLSSINWNSKEFSFFDYWGTYFRCKKIIEECRLYLDKLNGLPGEDAGDFAPISAAAANMPSV